jgi:hypothetical protein
MIKVRIKKVPKARTGYQVQGSLVNDIPAMGGRDYNAYIGAEKLKESKYITAVPREEANLEAEGGETVYGDINGDGMPEHKIIKGPRHHSGGVPLQLPEDTFIFSDTRKMRIKDPEILAMFGKSATSGKSFTPAELAKQYDIQKYRKILEDPETDAIDRKSAELMIKKYVVKLGCLALKQESMKGYPQGIPAVAKPCMEAKGLTEQDILPAKELSVLNDQLKKQMEQKNSDQTMESEYEDDQVQQAEEMNQGQPVAQPQQEQPSMEEMMRYGGYRRLRRAQEGMQQPSPEEMAMMQQQGQPQEQGGGQDEMMQIMQEVQSALQRGAEPTEVVASLLQNGLPPEGILQIFVQLGASQEEAASLIQQTMQQMQGGGQEQGMQQEQSVPQEQGMSEGQGMSEQEIMSLQQQGGPPMAMYGMTMGGYDMPFYDAPKAEYGMSMGSGMSQNYQGRPKPIKGSGPMFPLPKADNGIEVKDNPNWTPKEREDALRKAYVQSGRGKQKVYLIKANGQKVEQKITATGHDKYSGSDLDKWNGNEVAAATYEAMAQTFNDPKAKAAFANQVRQTLGNKEKYKGKGGGYSKMWKDVYGDPNDKSKLSDDEIVTQYLRMQERNLKTTTYGKKIGFEEGQPFGSWMYKDATGNIRDLNSSGSKKGDNRGFIDVVKDSYTAMGKTPPSDAEIKVMYDKIKKSGFTSLQAMSKDMGLNMNTLSSGRAESPYDKEAYLQQAAFHAANDLMKDIDANPTKYDEDTQAALLGITSFAGFKPYGKQVGYSDETGQGDINISPIDAWYTNTTQGEIQAHHGLKFEDVPDTPVDPDCQCDDINKPNYSKYKDANGNCTCTPPQPKKCPCVMPDKSVVEMTPDPKTGECPPCESEEDIPVPGPPAEWWLQDTIKTAGAFGDLMGIKKYMPWAPGVELGTPRPTFMDPTRELAANAEQANIQTAGMAQFAGPQALSSRSSGIQGQAAKNAADVLSRYNNANVNVANQFELKATDIRNQEAMLKQATNQRLYDQNTVANQQFDNAKLAMRNQLRNYYTNAITNRWKTDALNQMYPNYAVSPGVGGRMYYQPSDKTPNPNSASASNDYWAARDKCVQAGASDPDACARNATNNAAKNSGSGGSNPGGMINTMYPSKNGGPVYENGGLIYVDTWTPFIM